MKDKDEEKQYADDEKIMNVSEKLIEQNLEAYKELAKQCGCPCGSVKIHRRIST